MDKDLIAQVAKEIINQTIIQNYWTYFILLAVAFLGGYISLYLSGYAKKKGELGAMKSDMEFIKKQLSENAKITESIKNEYSLASWRKQQVETIRREKLEEYLTLIFQGKDYIMKSSYSLLLEENFDFKFQDDFVMKAVILVGLYFPELEQVQIEYMAVLNEFHNLTSELIVRQKKPLEQKTDLKEKVDLINKKMVQALTSVNRKTQELSKTLTIAHK